MGGGVYQLNNNQLFNLQLFADNNLNYNEVDNPYEFYLNKHIWAKGDIKKAYNLVNYYLKIPNHSTITTLPEENAEYIKEALPNVTSCYDMLYNCKALTSIDTTGWDTSNVTSMDSMFYDCNSLTSLDVSNWNTSNVTSMSSMFSGCNVLTNLDVSNWDTSKVTNMDWMFAGCRSLTTIKGVIDMKSYTTYGSYMFYNCNNLTGVKIKNPPSEFTNEYSSEISSGKIVIVQ